MALCTKDPTVNYYTCHQTDDTMANRSKIHEWRQRIDEWAIRTNKSLKERKKERVIKSCSLTLRVPQTRIDRMSLKYVWEACLVYCSPAQITISLSFSDITTLTWSLLGVVENRYICETITYGVHFFSSIYSHKIR